ncbi:hypothetical protein MPSEU_000928900 [Mayamaea pseudoterrestris]|nr:hypothetical protein MPSEU_000928900 [Mayamaea pseudoterrestris]
MSSSNMLLFGTDWATKVVSIRPHSDAHRKRSSCGGVTASLQAANSNSLSSATLLLRHRLMQRSYYGVLAQCFVAGPWIYSNTSTGSSMAGRINCSKQQREPLSAHRNLHDITRTTSSRRGLERMNDTGIQVHPFTSWSSSWSSLSTVMPNSSDNHRLLELLLASMVRSVATAIQLTI